MLTSKPLGTVAYMGGVPAVLEKFAWAWGQMIQFNAETMRKGEHIHYDRATASYLPWARNELARTMLGDWLLMLDTDHQFEPDVVIRMVRLMQDKGLRILTAIYQYKGHPYTPVVFGGVNGQRRQITDWSDDMTAFRVASAGAGTLLVRRDVFDQIRRELHEQPFDPVGVIGEDHSFFSRAGRCGIPAWCCPAIESHHLEIRPLSLELYDRPGIGPMGGTAVEGLRA